MNSNHIRTTLRDILARLYPDEGSMRRIISDSGIDAPRIDFSGRADNNWHAILTEAIHVEKIDELLAIVLKEYGQNQQFVVAYNEFLTLFKTGVLQNKDIEPQANNTLVEVNILPYIFEDFEIEISQGQGREYLVTVLKSPAGEARKKVYIPFSEIDLENRQLKLEKALLSSGGKRRAILSPEENAVRTFGVELFNLLFTGEIYTLYRESRHRSAQKGMGLRLKLRILSPQLAALPWEYLYDERTSEYICLSRNTPLLRYLELPQPHKLLTVVPPLRILGMIANPKAPELDLLDVEVEKQRVERALSNLQRSGLVELTWVKGETWRDLEKEMQRGAWHIFHFIGHGGFDQNYNEGMIILADQAGKAQSLRANQLCLLLADHPSLRFVFLNTCDGAHSSNLDIFSSTAASLMRRGIPAVMAMQYKITDSAAIIFAEAFYEALVERIPIDAAVSVARRAVLFDVNNSLEWGVPVLYMRTADGKIFDIVKPQQDLRPSAGKSLEENYNSPVSSVVTDLELTSEDQTKTQIRQAEYRDNLQQKQTDEIQPEKFDHYQDVQDLASKRIVEVLPNAVPDSERSSVAPGRMGNKNSTPEIAKIKRIESTHHPIKAPVWAGKTDCGVALKENGDSYYLFKIGVEPWAKDPAHAVYIGIVADGVTSKAGGEQASQLATKTIKAILARHMPGQVATHPQGLISQAIHQANREILETTRKNPEWGSMSTTLVLAAIADGQLSVAHLGDSRAYLLRGGEIYRLTLDHSWIQEALDLQRISPEEARTHPNRNVIRRYLGINPNIEVDWDIVQPNGKNNAAQTRELTSTISLQPGDVVLLCSNGLTKKVSDEEIGAIVKRHKGAPDKAADLLIKRALALKEQDNITVVLLSFAHRSLLDQWGAWLWLPLLLLLGGLLFLLTTNLPNNSGQNGAGVALIPVTTAVPTPTSAPTLPATMTAVPTVTMTPTSTVTKPPALVAQGGKITVTPPPSPTMRATTMLQNTSLPSPTRPTPTREPPTATNWSTDAPAAGPTVSQRSPGAAANAGATLKNPPADAQIEEALAFEFATAYGLQPGEGFEVVVWRGSDDPMAVTTYGVAAPIQETSRDGTYRISANLATMTITANTPLPSGIYQWGVLLVQVNPYKKLAHLGAQQALNYNPGGDRGNNDEPGTGGTTNK